jgi:hypothetical protein
MRKFQQGVMAMAITTDNQRRVNPDADLQSKTGTVRPELHVNQTTIPTRDSNSSAGFIALVVIVLAGLAFALYVYSGPTAMTPDIIQNNTSQSAPEVIPPVVVPDATAQPSQPDPAVQQPSTNGQTETPVPAPSTNP